MATRRNLRSRSLGMELEDRWRSGRRDHMGFDRGGGYEDARRNWNDYHEDRYMNIRSDKENDLHQNDNDEDRGGRYDHSRRSGQEYDDYENMGNRYGRNEQGRRGYEDNTRFGHNED